MNQEKKNKKFQSQYKERNDKDQGRSKKERKKGENSKDQ